MFELLQMEQLFLNIDDKLIQENEYQLVVLKNKKIKNKFKLESLCLKNGKNY